MSMLNCRPTCAVAVCTELSAPITYTSEKSEADNLSRIASRTVDTKVRLESVKLFEISSFTATLERSRHNFPILPPLVEIPYIGSFLSWPVPGAAEYHRSTAIMSAVVVPTAADLASGVAFTSDRVCVPVEYQVSDTPQSGTSQPSAQSGCPTRKALSLEDLSRAPIREFNKAMIRCLASVSPSVDCANLSFSKLLQIE